MKIGIIEVLVILSILITSGALVYKYISTDLSKDTYEFDGEQMYKCAWISEKIMSKGFPLYAQVYGKWTGTGEAFNGTVLILRAQGGTLYGLYNDHIISIGGNMAYREDIAAEKIVLKPLGNTIIYYQINPVGGDSFKEIINKIENTKRPYEGLNITILETYISGILAVDSKTYTPTEQQYIRNEMDDINRGNKLTLNFLDGGLSISGRLNLNNLELYDYLIKPNKVYTSKMTIYLIVNETIMDLPKNITQYNNDTKIITLN